jgi:hypothetical protein
MEETGEHWKAKGIEQIQANLIKLDEFISKEKTQQLRKCEIDEFRYKADQMEAALKLVREKEEALKIAAEREATLMR